MFKTNTYFDNTVISVAYENKNGKATVGVMKPGEYTFGTSTVEFMTVISGNMQVQLKGESSWKTYKPFETFKVEANSSFNVKVSEETSYNCVYE